MKLKTVIGLSFALGLALNASISRADESRGGGEVYDHIPSRLDFLSKGFGAASRPIGSKLAESISVDDFGARSGGCLVDAAPCINAAIQWAYTQNTGTVLYGATVLLPHGTPYLIKTPIIMEGGVTLEGECFINSNASVAANCGAIRANANFNANANSAMITQSDLTVGIQDVGIINVMIDGNQQNFTVNNIVALSALGSRIYDSSIGNASGNGIHWIANSVAAWLNHIFHNTIYTNGKVGLWFEGTDSTVESNVISGNGTGTILDGTGAVVFTNNHVEVSTFWGLVVKPNLFPFQDIVAAYQITNNKFLLNNNANTGTSSGDYSDIFFDNAGGLFFCPSLVTGNLFNGTAGTNIIVGVSCSGGLISDNQFLEAGASAAIKFGGYPTINASGTFTSAQPFPVGGNYGFAMGTTYSISGAGIPSGTTATYNNVSPGPGSNGTFTASATVTFATTGEIIAVTDGDTTIAGPPPEHYNQWRVGPNSYGLSPSARFLNVPADVLVDAGGGSGGFSPPQMGSQVGISCASGTVNASTLVLIPGVGATHC